MVKAYKNCLTVRGDCLYCPLPLSIDSYWNCSTDCFHCFFRRLNRTWGTEQRAADLGVIASLLEKGAKYKGTDKQWKQWALNGLKEGLTIRWGSKSDPFQEDEEKYRVGEGIFQLLIKFKRETVIQTRHIFRLYQMYENYLLENKELFIIMPVMSPGLDKDWEIFERKRTTKPIDRLKIFQKLQRAGLKGGFNGEPFIPGFHTVKDFEETLKLLKDYGVKNYNTYNFHFNDFVAKRIYDLPGVDIEKIWFYNQDKYWKPILRELLDLAKKYDIVLGCPDFVNSGWGWEEKANTCCGINVKNPSKFNTHWFKKLIQKGKDKEEILKRCYQGIGDFKLGKKVMYGKTDEFYTMEDIR